VSAPIVARLREYDGQKTQQRITAAPHSAKFEREDSFTPQLVPL
jgi:hypothetical protein